MNDSTRAAITAAKATPPVSAATALMAGIELDVWVQLAALTYTLILICERVWKWGLPQRFWRWGVALWEEHRGRI
jgi:hypothetical protein